MDPRETDVGRAVRNVARVRLYVALAIVGVVLFLCVYGGVALAAILVANAAQGR